eukprot:scaffold62399_cov30-Prasinocladus_malaysianus.AAC.1
MTGSSTTTSDSRETARARTSKSTGYQSSIRVGVATGTRTLIRQQLIQLAASSASAGARRAAQAVGRTSTRSRMVLAITMVISWYRTVRVLVLKMDEQSCTMTSSPPPAKLHEEADTVGSRYCIP